MTNPTDPPPTTEPQIESRHPIPTEDVVASLVGHAKGGSDDSLEKKLRSLHDLHDRFEQLFAEMDRLAMRLFKLRYPGAANKTSSAGTVVGESMIPISTFLFNPLRSQVMTTSTNLRPPIMPRCEAPPPYPSQKDFTALVGRALEGDDKALEELQQLLDHYDDLGQSLDTISRMVERHLIGVAAGNSRPMHGRILRFIAKVRHAFFDGEGDAMEEFLVDRIVVAYLMVHIRKNRATEFVSDEERRRRELALEEANQRQLKFVSAFSEYRVVREFGSDRGIPG